MSEKYRNARTDRRNPMKRHSMPLTVVGQYAMAAVFLALPTVPGILALQDAWPARTPQQAMEKGQFERAAHLLQQTSNQNDPQAMVQLANLHYLGLGVERDPAAAATLYHAAASQGLATAQLNLGHLYRQGQGVERNSERAFGWYVHADIAGSEYAEYYLSLLSSELTLTPLQMDSARRRWQKLDSLLAEPQ